MFVLDSASGMLVEKEITYTPGLYKIFDEIVVNAADNKQRDPNMSELHIEINAEENFISVMNNGKGIPIQMHKEHKCYVPTMIFSHLLSGSNFDDNEKKTTGGRNGYGAKLTNIFSREFTIECMDSEEGLKFKQVFRNNMSIVEEPIIKKCTAAEKKKGDFVKISFRPDLEKFQMEHLDEDFVALLSKRAYDIAGSMANRHGKKLSVTLNGKKLPVQGFRDYLKLFTGINQPEAFEKSGDWEVGIASSMDGVPQQVSFVNAICTSKGGEHVKYIAEQVAKHLEKTVAKKNKGGAPVKPTQIKNHLCIFVNCLIENPTFDSQTKVVMSLKPTKATYASACKLSEKFLKQLDKSTIVEACLDFAKVKQNQALKRKGGVKRVKLTGIAKLDDANNAGGSHSQYCTLIVTEGDSASK
jgi:DNA topoisomerase II